MHIPINRHHTMSSLALNSSLKSLLIPCYLTENSLKNTWARFVFAILQHNDAYNVKITFNILSNKCAYNSQDLLLCPVPKTHFICQVLSNTWRAFHYEFLVWHLILCASPFTFILLWLKTTWGLHEEICHFNLAAWGHQYLGL